MKKSPVLVLAVAIVLTAAACDGTDASTGPPAASGPPRSGGTLTFATDADPGCLDPHQSPTAASQLVSRGVVDSLVVQDPQSLALKPWLAQSWTISPDATSFQFKLRDGVTFSDGTPFNADAVRANFDRIVDPATKSLLSAGLLAGYSGSTVTDQHTVTVKFSKSNAAFLQAASTAFLGMQSPAAFSEGPQTLCQKPVGSGPFVVSGRVVGQSITLAKRVGYNWGPPSAKHQGAAYLDRVAVTVVPENGVRLGSLRSNQVDAIASVPPKNADSLGGGFQLLSKRQPGLAYTLDINASVAPWNDVTMRRAFAKSVDTDQIVNTLYQGKYPRAASVLTSATPGYFSVLPTTQYDKAAAEKLFDQAGWHVGADGMRARDGRPLTIEWTYISPAREQRDLLAQLVQQQLRQVGVDVRLTPLAVGEIISRQAKGQWQLSDISFVRADGDVLRTVLTAPQGGTPAVVDPGIPPLLADATTTVDQSKRDADYAQVQRLLVDKATSIPIYDPTYLLGAGKAVHDLTFDPQGLPSCYDTWVLR